MARKKLKQVERGTVRVVQQVFVKPVCNVVNRKGIQNAKDVRSAAGQTLDDAQRRLSTQQQQLNKRRGQLSDAQAKRNTVNQQRNSLNLDLSNLKSKDTIISSLAEQFAKISTHLATVVGSAEVLNNEIKRLLDFELVIEPLNALVQQMTQNGLMSSFGFEISADTIVTLTTFLNQINEKLASLPLIIRKIPSNEQNHHVMLTISQVVTRHRSKLSS